MDILTFYTINVAVLLLSMVFFIAHPRHVRTVGRTLFRTLLWISHVWSGNLLVMICSLLFVCLITYLSFYDGLFRPISARSSRERSGNLALINLILLSASPSQNFLSWMLGLRRKMFAQIHACLGLATVLLVVSHGWMSIVVQNGFPLHVSKNVWGLVAGGTLVVVILLTRLRNASYEWFAYMHPFAALLLVVPLGRHMTPNLYFYSLVAGFPIFSLAQLGWLLYVNLPNRSGRRPKSLERAEAESDSVSTVKQGEAIITNLKDTVQKRISEDAEKYVTRHPTSLKHDLIQVRLKLARPTSVKEGQYVSICIPSNQLCDRPFTQIHPFSVVSWSASQATTIDLLIEPREGWTKDLLRYSRQPESSPLPVLVAGPYGTSTSTDNYEVVLLVASGLGIIAQLPYIKKLIYNRNKGLSHTQRVLLVWQLRTPDLLYIFQEKLSRVFKGSKIFDSAVFIESGFTREFPLEVGNQMIVHPGLADMGKIIQAETPEDVTSRRGRGEMIILVSATKGIRKEVKQASREYVFKGVALSELEYQPETFA